MFRTPIATPGSNRSTSLHRSSYLSFAPPELSFGKFQADEQGWVDTIKSVKFRGTVRISTMGWLGQSQYTKQTVYWDSLSSAISETVGRRQRKGMHALHPLTGVVVPSANQWRKLRMSMRGVGKEMVLCGVLYS